MATNSIDGEFVDKCDSNDDSTDNTTFNKTKKRLTFRNLAERLSLRGKSDSYIVDSSNVNRMRPPSG